MKSIFILHHVHKYYEDEKDVKLIGIYASRDEATAAVNRLKTQPGFVDHPDEFEMEEYEIGKDHWTEGFCSRAEAMDAVPEHEHPSNADEPRR